MSATVPLPLLQVRHLAVTVGGHRICQGLDFDLLPGERLAILGRNGAGKSTLLSTLAGLRPPVAGQVLLEGCPYGDWGPRQAALRRGWLAQSQGDAFSSTVLEGALAGRHPHLGRWDWESEQDRALAQAALAAVGLAGLEQRQSATLSGGERQRLGIATLLTQAPHLYLLDEPLAYLDLNHQVAMLELFSAQARDGAGLVLVLHDPAMAARYCDRVLLLYGDGEAEVGPADQLLTGARLSRLYGHPLERAEVHGHVVFIPA